MANENTTHTQQSEMRHETLEKQLYGKHIFVGVGGNMKCK